MMTFFTRSGRRMAALCIAAAAVAVPVAVMACAPFIVIIHKTGPATVYAGDIITYHIQVTNQSNQQLTGLLKDPIPAGLTFEPSASTRLCITNPVWAQWGITGVMCFGNPKVWCPLGFVGQPPNSSRCLDQNETVNYSVSFRVPRTATCGSVITNQATYDYSPYATFPSEIVRTTVLCAPNVTITKTGPESVLRGQTAVFTVTASNIGQGNADNVIVTDPVPAGTTFNAAASNTECSLQGANVVCQLGTLAGGQSRTLSIAFDVPLVNPCTGTTIQNQATVSTTSTESHTDDNSSTIVKTQVTCVPGCIDIVKETFNTAGDPLTPVPQFTFKLDGNTTTVNTGDGRARFSNVSLGNHIVTEVIPSGWNQFNVTPLGGGVTVDQGPQCAVVTFKNQQVLPLGSSSSSRSSSSSVSSVPSSSSSISSVSFSSSSVSSVASVSSVPSLGCIQILKEAFDSDGRQLSVVPQFSFVLDGSTTVTSDASGNARFSNVSLGTHTVTETVPGGWNQFNVTPSGGTVVVTGVACSGMTFKNQQIVAPSASSSSAPVVTYQPQYTVYTSYQPSPQYPLVAYTPPAPVAGCSLSVQKNADRSEAQSGDLVRYTVTVKNEGGRDAHGVVVVDTPEGGATVVDAGGGVVSGNGVRWEIGALGTGQSRSFGYSVRLGMGLGNGQSVRNRVNVQSSDCGRADAQVLVGIIQELPQTGGMGGIFRASVEHLRKIRNGENGEWRMENGKWGWVLALGLCGAMAGIGGFVLQRKNS